MPTSKKSNVFVYGSLRKGMYNYEAFKHGMEYKDTKTIQGFEMYSLGAYPFVTPNEEEEVVVDHMVVDERTKQQLDRMEFGAGYKAKEIEVDGVKGTIYYFETIRTNKDKVKNGDWVKHYGT